MVNDNGIGHDFLVFMMLKSPEIRLCRVSGNHANCWSQKRLIQPVV